MKTLTERMHTALSVITQLVKESGFPVAAPVLIRAGTATRSELRKLERDGHLIQERITLPNGAVANAYYTEGAIPYVITGHERAYHTQPAEVDHTQAGEEPAR